MDKACFAYDSASFMSILWLKGRNVPHFVLISAQTRLQRDARILPFCHVKVVTEVGAILAHANQVFDTH